MKSSESTPAAAATRSHWGLLIALMIPVGMATMNMSMFGVALPTVRDAFAVDADMTAWLLAAYSLPFVIFMPRYGKLGDSLGKARLFQSGIVFFFAGSLICVLAKSLPQLLIGRVLQGMGTAGYYPLCIAIIAERFPAEQRGRAMGTWSSVAPGASTLGPMLGGFAVDNFGWNCWPTPAICSNTANASPALPFAPGPTAATPSRIRSNRSSTGTQHPRPSASPPPSAARQ